MGSIEKIAICVLLIVLTTTIHAWAMVFAIRAIRWTHVPKSWHVYRVSIVVLVMATAAILETLCWALTYIWVGAIDGLRKALYFSTVTYTTLGYGDVVLEPAWQLVAAFTSINGIIMFGWSTAIVIAAIQNIYFPHTLNHSTTMFDGDKPD
jgi:hypothetical protein